MSIVFLRDWAACIIFFSVEATYNEKMKLGSAIILLCTIFLAACQPVSGSELPTLAAAASVDEAGAAARPSVTVQSAPPGQTPAAVYTETPVAALTAAPPIVTSTKPAPAATAGNTPLPAVTSSPTATASPTIEPTATYWPTVTRQILPAEQAAGLVPCSQRPMTDDLLLVATQQFTLPQSYVPADLVPLSDYFSEEVMRGLDLYARAAIVEPLQQMVEAMYAAGLRPSILSAYRSYNEQALAWKWWESQYPGRVAIMSARPGASEHQLGATIDFGSPEINHLFHVDFANTSEGIWLAANAHQYGFTLSYPRDAYGVTGFKYEPWHFRYVGPELAGQLYNSGQILTEWQLENMPPPCIP
ncbi:MAG TPA: hypothetical protein EYH05_02410 [Anaerolineae bacterium]|nr:hypothetical protein [Anaerolineae bacterium]